MEANQTAQKPQPAVQPQATNVVANPKPQPFKSSMFKIILAVVITFMLTSICFLLWFNTGLKDTFITSKPTSNGDSSTPNETSPTPVVTEELQAVNQTFTGDEVTAEIPQDWDIVEYKDGAGTDMVVGGQVYTGLTGLEVLNANNNVVFKMKAVDGVGGLGTCSEIFKFSDTQQTYIDQLIADGQAVEGAGFVYQINDLSNETYVNLNIFGNDARRIATALYWNDYNAVGVFNPLCGINAAFIIFDEIEFGVQNAPAGYIAPYEVTITTGTTAADLLILDAILNSLEAVI